ncbi:MAG TPA: DegT/DnrJ/EryC1/StrS family aminotransferase [Dongiaceae bacterium]
MSGPPVLTVPPVLDSTLSSAGFSSADPNSSPLPAAQHDLVCRRDDSLLSIIEKCLNNTLGCCLVLDDDRRPLGEVSLDEIRLILREGRLTSFHGWAEHLAIQPGHSTDSARALKLHPVLDGSGRVGAVAFDRSRDYVQIARPDLSQQEFRLLLDAFLSSWISSSGEYLSEFQARFAALLGCKHAIAVSNGTVALHLALETLGLGPGDEVILPDLTFAATINAVLHCGATPVIVDIDPLDWGLDIAKVRRAVTRRTKALIPVHLYGRPANLDALCEFAGERGIAIVEDCAQALGARHGERMVGRFGAIGCFSFFANKTITTGEGGMCVTDSDAIAGRLKELRDHGMTPGRRYWHERSGFNGRMTNLQAAIGVAQLSRLPEIMARNRRLDALYRQHLGAIAGVSFPPPLPDHIEPAIWLVSALITPGKRDALIAAAAAARIELRPFFYSLSTMPPYRRYGGRCPTSLGLSARGINLPTSNAVDESVIAKLAGIAAAVLR